MAGGSTLDPDNFPQRRDRKTQEGHDTKSLGPSDSSDSGSDMAGPGLVGKVDQLNLDRGTNQDTEAGRQGAGDAGPSSGDLGLNDNSDRFGTGEHLTAGKDPDVRINADRDADRIVGADEAGLGGGLDQAEEAQLGKTDEQLRQEGKRRRNKQRR